jgi:putative MATE family efflux protein
MDHSQQLGQAPIGKLLFKFSLPSILGMLVSALYNIVDRVFIGQGVGSLAIAGITVSFPLTIFMMACGMLIAFGATTLISIRLGEGEKAEAEVILGQALALFVLVYGSLSALGLMFSDPLLRWFGASPTTLLYAREYLRIILLGGVFNGVGFGLMHLIRAEGSPAVSMRVMLIGAVLNTILDPIFIFGFKWGVAGAAWATCISQIASAAWALCYYLCRQSTLKVRLGHLRPQGRWIGQIVILGMPVFLIEAITSVEAILMNNSLSKFSGDLAISGMGIVNSVILLILMPIFGINLGVQPILGFNFGARNYARVKRALLLAIAAATAVVCMSFIGCQLFAEAVISMFNPHDPELIRLGAHMLRVFLMMLPMVGFQIVCGGYFQAVGRPKEAMIITMTRQAFILIPALLILPRIWGFEGILWSEPVADAGGFCLAILWFSRELQVLNRNGAEALEDEPPVEAAG